MKILFLAPQPFYQERGTPIAVDLVLRALSERGDEVDLVTFHEGEMRPYERVAYYRIPALPFLNGIRPGFSLKKVFCDVLLFFKAFSLLLRKRYDRVHAVEESVFMAMVFRLVFQVPYVYDMDSSMAEQIAGKYRLPTRVLRLLEWLEGQAARQADAVIAVCGSLAARAGMYGAQKIFILPDISF